MTEKSAIREALEKLDEVDPELALRLRKEIGLSELNCNRVSVDVAATSPEEAALVALEKLRRSAPLVIVDDLITRERFWVDTERGVVVPSKR